MYPTTAQSRTRQLRASSSHFPSISQVNDFTSLKLSLTTPIHLLYTQMKDPLLQLVTSAARKYLPGLSWKWMLDGMSFVRRDTSLLQDNSGDLFVCENLRLILNRLR